MTSSNSKTNISITSDSEKPRKQAKLDAATCAFCRLPFPSDSARRDHFAFRPANCINEEKLRLFARGQDSNTSAPARKRMRANDEASDEKPVVAGTAVVSSGAANVEAHTTAPKAEIQFVSLDTPLQAAAVSSIAEEQQRLLREISVIKADIAAESTRREEYDRQTKLTLQTKMLRLADIQVLAFERKERR
jgi:hypothetical protein